MCEWVQYLSITFVRLVAAYGNHMAKCQRKTNTVTDKKEKNDERRACIWRGFCQRNSRLAFRDFYFGGGVAAAKSRELYGD